MSRRANKGPAKDQRNREGPATEKGKDLRPGDRDSEGRGASRGAAGGAEDGDRGGQGRTHTRSRSRRQAALVPLMRGRKKSCIGSYWCLSSERKIDLLPSAARCDRLFRRSSLDDCFHGSRRLLRRSRLHGGAVALEDNSGFGSGASISS